MFSQNDMERERYEGRLKARRDYSTSVKVAKEEGRAEGRKEGRKVGRMIGRIHVFQEILGLTTPTHDQLENLPLVELQQLARQLENEISNK